MVRMCSWCGGYSAMQSIGVDECEICYYLPGHEGASDLVQIPASELARLQDENRRLRAFVEEFIEEAPRLDNDRHWWTDKWYEFADKAAALLASMKPAEDSE